MTLVFVLPADVGLLTDVRRGNCGACGRQRVGAACEHFREAALPEIIGVCNRSGSVHQRSVDDGGELAPQHIGFDHLLKRLPE